ncbi:nucleoside 2-deoxyribosyltransferase domain-containing protein [Romboutsia sp. 1001713B170207_170306_H8]|uniref:nucleoside 2-deoxyribosyltransferase domain-containing protein n=1 Tax=Romboutsia sp. 1001713B170207_170306_H8 TaxID=2787112 RepID=UPI001897F14D|nr:nucleoside 2-deoxyribosyltransferase domain-containing protein [Romboutsia sp. 1001713B170207_170306_H8]
MKKVFLGGTCNGSTWREELIELLEIDYFNPVVDDWTEECMKEEIRQRETCDYCLYVLTPRMGGVYTIAEVVDDINKRPERTVFCVLKEDVNPAFGTSTHIYFNKAQLKSLEQLGKMVRKNGGKYFRTLEDVAEYLNA